MNKQRRRAIEDVIEPVRLMIETLETLRDEEQEYYDNMPDSFRDGDKGSRAEGNVTVLDDIISKLEEVEQDVGSIEGGE